MLGSLGGIQEVFTVFGPRGSEAEPVLRTSLTRMSPEQRAPFEILNMKRYAAR
jgi:hypothetical protein